MYTDRVMGRIPVLECLKAGKRRAHKLYVLRGAKGLDALLRAARNIPVESVGKFDLEKLVDGVHQGVVLEAEPVPVIGAESWLRQELPDDALVVLLDGVVDPHNFGAIVRSAAACGAIAVAFAKDRAAPISPASVKSAAGAMEHIDLLRATNLVRFQKALQDAGFWITALDAEAEKTIWEVDLKGRTALAIGSEGKGLRRLVSAQCDFHARIPLSGPITSLNASVSAAAALIECSRQRLSV